MTGSGAARADLLTPPRNLENTSVADIDRVNLAIGVYSQRRKTAQGITADRASYAHRAPHGTTVEERAAYAMWKQAVSSES